MSDFIGRRGIPKSLEASQILKFGKPLGEEWVGELWTSLLDAHLLVFSIHKQILPTNETLVHYESDFEVSSLIGETDLNVSAIFIDSLLDHSILDNVWKPVTSYVCQKELIPQDLKASLDLKLRMLHLVFWARTRHIALFVHKLQTGGCAGAGSKEVQDGGLETLKKMVACVDQMLQHSFSERDQQTSTQSSPSKPSPAPIHLGKEINRECWATHLIVARFDTSTRTHYISFETRLFLLCVIHAMAIVMVFYLHWRSWISFVICWLCNILTDYGYFGDFESSARLHDERTIRLKSDIQIGCLHALMYAYLNLSVKESAYILLWAGALIGLNRLSEYWMTKRTKAMQYWPQLKYDALAVHFVFCGVHLRHGWLWLTVGSWFTGTIINLFILAAIPKANLIQALYPTDVPGLYLLIYIATSVSVVRTAISFLYQLFVPIIMELLIKWVMNIIGWRSSPIDLSGSIMKGFMNVLMVFWGFSPWQAFGLTMAMQTFSSLQALAPAYGMT